jgi:hypothetical protein
VNKALAFAWADELESGNHIQGKSALEYVDLKDENKVKRCCLGVAARLCALPSSWIEVPQADSWDGLHRTWFAGQAGILALDVQYRLGMQTDDGNIPSLRDRDNRALSLAVLNDSGLTFPQIADIIRYFYEEL